MSTGDETTPPAGSEELRRQAAEWIGKRDAGFTPAEQDEFFEWLAADPQRAEAYAQVQAVYRRMDIMAEWRPLHAPEPNPDLLAAPRPRPRFSRPFAVLGGVAAALALAFVLWASAGDRHLGEGRLLAAGESARSHERHVLEDGSIVELNRGGQVSLRFEKDRRLLDLVSGEAHFKVAKDPRRPFVVRASGVAVTAVGTEFAVALGAEKVEVFVTEGRIVVDPRGREDEAAAPAPGAQALQAGQGVLVSLAAPAAPLRIEDYPAPLIAQKLAWKNELVGFTATPLSEVILEFNRRNHTQLVIGDDDLRDRAITGTLRPDNLEGFLEVLAVTHRIRAERHGTSKIVLKRQD